MSKYLLCVLCEELRDELFRSALGWAAELGSERLRESDLEDLELGNTLSVRGGHWAMSHYLVITASGGHHAGLRAVGMGSNVKKRRRAARLALAATAALHDTNADSKADQNASAEPPELADLVLAARQGMQLLTSATPCR